MKEKTSKFLLALAGVAAISASASAGSTYPGCPVPAAQECVCDVLPDLNNYGVMFGAKGCETKKIVFSGLIQTDFQYLDVDDRMAGTVDPEATTNFLMRRVRFGIDADLGNNWRGVIAADFAGKQTQNVYTSNGNATADGGWAGGINEGTLPSNNDQFTPNGPITMTTNHKHGLFGLYEAYIEKYCSGNHFIVGYKKVRFMREENVPDEELKTIERSIATTYFNGTDSSSSAGVLSGGPLDFGRQHVGVFVDGLYNHFGYGAALVNGFQGTKYRSDIWDNELGIYANIYYLSEFNCMDLEIGLNGGYQQKGNGEFLRFNANSAWLAKRGSIWSLNPYVTVGWNGWTLLAEFSGAKAQRGSINGLDDAKPFGINGVLTYMWNDCFELVFRGSYLDTDDRGFRLSNVYTGTHDTTALSGITGKSKPGVPGTGITALPAGDLYNKANAWYFGFNYYMANRAVKFSAGYEFIRLKERCSGLTEEKTVDGQTVRVFAKSSFTTPTAAAGNEKAYAHLFKARLQLVF